MKSMWRRMPVVVILSLMLAMSGCAGPTPAADEGVESVDDGTDAGSPLLNEIQSDGPIPCASPAPDAEADPSVTATEATAMEEDRFWSLIDTLDGSTDYERFDALTAELAELPPSDIVAFQARLTLALFALDSGCRAEWYRLNEPEQLGFVSDDTFLYARADRVSAGRQVWTTAVETQTLPWGTVDPSIGGGETLLYVAADATEVAGNDLDEYYDRVTETVLVSYETGSSRTGWPEAG